ncbi:hypothetical protein Tco_0766714 [Tanacetum coccineum]
MDFGKDKSNPLIVDSLLKIIRLSIHLVVYNKELAISEQTATGKGISNPLIAELSKGANSLQAKVEWNNYKHLDWITVRRDDDKLYKFKEGDFNRLRIQDIEHILLLLVQDKLTNLTVE